MKKLERGVRPDKEALHEHLVSYFRAYFAGDQAEVDRLSTLPDDFPTPTTNDYLEAIRDAKATLKDRGTQVGGQQAG